MSNPSSKPVSNKVKEAFLWGFLLPLPLGLITSALPGAVVILLPFLFGLAFILVNQDRPDARKQQTLLALLIFPLSFWIVVLMVWLSMTLWAELNLNFGIGVFLAPILTFIVAFPGFVFSWAFLRNGFHKLEDGMGLRVSAIGSAILAGVALLGVLLGNAFEGALTDSDLLNSFFFLVLFGLAFGGVNAWYRYLIEKYQWYSPDNRIQTEKKSEVKKRPVARRSPEWKRYPRSNRR